MFLASPWCFPVGVLIYCTDGLIFFLPGAQMEVDYTEKLNFSDDEDNHAAKEKGDSW